MKHLLTSEETKIIQTYNDIFFKIFSSAEQELMIKDFEIIANILKSSKIYKHVCVIGLKLSDYEAFLDSIDPKIFFKTKLFLINIHANGYVSVLFQAINHITTIWNEKNVIINAELITSSKISEEVLKDLEDKLTHIKGKKVELKNTVKPKILGGYKLTIDGKNLDLSYHNLLDKLKNHLNANITL